MTEPWGESFYAAAAIIAALVALLAVFNFLYNFSVGEPIIPVVALGLAAIIWLIGLWCRNAFDAP
jgi:protein-S-isoprenylcysteine O-methyltransferase Ste14